MKTGDRVRGGSGGWQRLEVNVVVDGRKWELKF
jgi:hypothetical protein